MAANITFYGFIKSQDSDWETFNFVMNDIYIKELNKWLKADSPDDGKAFFNLEALKSSKSLAFYTMSESSARWALGEKQKLKDFFEYKKKSPNAFTLKIIAMSGNFTSIIECRDCLPVQSLLSPTPVGVMQSYELKYKEARFEISASHPAAKSNL